MMRDEASSGVSSRPYLVLGPRSASVGSISLDAGYWIYPVPASRSAARDDRSRQDRLGGPYVGQMIYAFNQLGKAQFSPRPFP